MQHAKNNFKFPKEIKDIVGGINHPKQWNILEILLSNGNVLHYKKLRSKLGINKNDKEFQHNLNELQKNSWLYNETEKYASLDDIFNSRYGITEFGLIIIEGIMASFKNALIKANSVRELKEKQFRIDIKKTISNNLITARSSFDEEQNELIRETRVESIKQLQINRKGYYESTNELPQQLQNRNVWLR